MTFKGIVKNGVVVLPDEVKLPDGVEVEVRLRRPSKRDWEKFLANCVGVGDDEPNVSSNHHRYFANAVRGHVTAKKKRSQRQ
jgi:hypothetical protein